MTLDKEKIKKILDSIRALENIVPESVYHEIQESEDGEEVLFISVSLRSPLQALEMDDLRYEVESIIHPQMPSYKHAHSWIVCFFYNNEQVDAIMGGLRGWVV